ncbi:coat protein [Soybean ilarvirus I]|uniref:Coat protein n=1 Tax=Soybean ilarvirus I TaxID=2982525 RepID=A0A977XD32_9BROM|nr:coat protein [Soybean ilarvirus I]
MNSRVRDKSLFGITSGCTNTSIITPDHPSNVMSSSQGSSGQVSNRQRRNARRAAAYRNKLQQQPIAKVPVPVPVVPTRPIPVYPASQQKAKNPLKLPNNQVWVRRDPGVWNAKTNDTNDAIPITTMLSGIPEIRPETKIYRLIFGFVAESNGSFGIVEDEGVAGNTVPDPPVVGREKFQKHEYTSRDVNLEGKTSDELKYKAVIWCLDENRRAEKRVSLTHYWFAISRPPPLMPPADILVNGNGNY